MPAKEYKKLRLYLANTGIKARVTKRYGLPFLLRKYSGRVGILIGGVIFVVLLWVFSQFIWSVNVSGNKEISSTEILSVLRENGVYSGAYTNGIDVKATGRKVVEKLPEIRWISINITSCKADVEVKEKYQAPKKMRNKTPCNVKAKKDALIVKTNVLNGTKMTEKGSAVIKGQLLVSGVMVDAQGNSRIVPAEAEIFGRTHYEKTYKLPKKRVMPIKTGETMLRRRANLLWVSVPVDFDRIPWQSYSSITKTEVMEINKTSLPVSMTKEYNKKYNFDEAVDIVRKALSVLGEEYINIYNNGIKDRWIDVYPTRNKRTGGYSSGCYDTYPYVLLNYQDKYNDMSTLAHEMGHSIHSYYARHNNSYVYGDYSIFVAEVASTVNELLLAKYMIKNSSSKEEKLYVINKLLELFRATIYRQTMFAEFEKEIYSLVENDEILTADLLDKKYYELNEKYFGNNVVIDKEIMYEWERIPHFYYNFYVYKYATGLSCACMIVNNILSGKKGAVSNYINFLKCGRTKNPIDSLKVAGVDITKKEVINSAIDMFSELIDEFSLLYFE